MKSSTLIRFFVGVLCVQLLLAVLVFLATLHGQPKNHAIISMAIGLIVVWIIVGGLLMLRFRNPIRHVVLAVPLPWWLKFLAFCTIMAMVEEAITTSLTNLAPFFGSQIGVAFITASANYWDVVLGNSVIAFVPMFLGWTFLLFKYDFRPNQVFLLYGLLGTFVEAQFGGPQHFLEIGLWMFVYGLMVYLPAYSLPPRPNLRQPRWWTYLFALLVPWMMAVLFLLVTTPLIHALRPSTLHSFLHP